VSVEPAEPGGAPVGGGTAAGSPVAGVTGPADDAATTETPATSAGADGELGTGSSPRP
jgi:hypothetical protein